MEPTLHLPERRRRDLRGRLARATYPVRHAVVEFVGGLPCNVIGHRWVEVRPAVRRAAGGKSLRFNCSRCRMSAGFTS